MQAPVFLTLIALSVPVLGGVVGCYPTPGDRYDDFVARAGQAASDARVDGAAANAGCGGAFAWDGESLAGAFVLVFTFDLKPEPSPDTLLELSLSDESMLRGRAVAADDPGLVLGTLTETAFHADCPLVLIVERLTIPPGQESVLPNGGVARVALHVEDQNDDWFCGMIEFDLLEPISLPAPQQGPFAAYREGVALLGPPVCPP